MKKMKRNDTIFLVNGSDGMKKTYLKSIVNNTEEIALGSGESSLNIEYNLLSERT